MKHRFLILFLLLSYLGVSQTQIPLAGFKATLNTFPIISGDTMTAKFTLLDVSNQFNGTSLKTRDSLVIWKNCKRYRIDTVLQAFATQVTVRILRGGNPSLTPGICALVEETKTNKSFAPFSITDGERQCIQSYYVGSDTIAPKVYVDTVFINDDSLYYVLGTDTFNVGRFPKGVDSIWTAFGNIYYSKDGNEYIIDIPEYLVSIDRGLDNALYSYDLFGQSGEILNALVPTGGSEGQTIRKTDTSYEWQDYENIDSILVYPQKYYSGGLVDSLNCNVLRIRKIENTDITNEWLNLCTPSDTTLIETIITNALDTIDQDQIVSITGAGITNVTGTYPNFTVTSTEADGDPNNEKQTLSQSFTGTTQATATLSLSGGNYVDTTGFMRLETMFSTAGSRTYRYKSNLGAIMGITEDPTLSGNSNIEVLRTGNQLTWGLRKDNASNGQFYKYNGTAWALATAPTGTLTSIATTSPITGGTITGSGTIGINTANTSTTGALTSTDWNTFNGKVGGSGTTNYIPKWSSSSGLTNSLGFDNGTTFSVGASGSPNSAGRFEALKTYSNTSDVNIVASGNIPMIGFNKTSSYRFAIGSGYSDATQLSILGASSTGSNPTTQIVNFQNDGFTRFYGNLQADANLRVGSSASEFSFNHLTTNPTDAQFYVNLAASKSFRIQAASSLAYMEFYTPASGSNRNFRFATSYNSPGDFNLLRSTTAGGTPSTLVWTANSTGFGINTGSPSNTLDVDGTLRVRTTNSVTGTAVLSRDANGVITTLGLSGLSVSGGNLVNSNTGTVTNFSAGDLSPLFTTTETSTTTTPALSFTQVAQSANTVFSGPTSGGTANPTFRSLVGPDLPAPIILDYSYTGTTQTFTKTSYPGAKKVKVILIGGGGSGGSGQVTAKTTGASARGGGGGGSGAWVETDFEISSLQTTTDIVVGAGGATEAGITSSSSANGIVGNDGALSSFGLLLVAYGGKGGAPGETSPDSGYGFGGYGRNSWASNGGSGGNFFAGNENDTDESQNLWYSSNGGGGGGGQYESSTATISTNGGKSNRLATLADSGATGAGGANGTSSSAATSGSLWGRYMSTGGGGGGGSSSQTNRNGAAGGGGGYGAGGGGGAGVLSTGSSITSGSGGAGAPGRCIVIVYF